MENMTYRGVAFNKMGAAKYYTAVAVSFFCKLILLLLFPFVLVGAFFHAIFALQKLPAYSRASG